MAYPIQSLPDGRVKWSDGSITGAMSTNQGYVSTQRQPSTSYNTSSPGGYQIPQAPAPQTGGQSSGGGGGGGLDPHINPATGQWDDNYYAQNNPQKASSYEDVLRSETNQLRSQLEGQYAPLLESYNLAKGDVQGQLTEAGQVAEAKKDETNQQFGDLLANTLKTYRETGRNVRNVFSGLGSLDSSAYADSQIKNEQGLAEQRSRQGLAQNKAIGNIDRDFANYQREANSQLAQLALQYQQARTGIANLIAQNDIAGAERLAAYRDQLRDKAQQVQQFVVNLGLEAARLKSQGVDLVSGIRDINNSGVIGNLLGSVNQYGNSAAAQFRIPSAVSPQGQGYIAPNNRAEDERRRFAL